MTEAVLSASCHITMHQRHDNAGEYNEDVFVGIDKTLNQLASYNIKVARHCISHTPNQNMGARLITDVAGC